MSFPNKLNWSDEDNDIEQEFAEVISLVETQNDEVKIPKSLDQNIKQFARGSVFDEIEKSWVFSSGARLTLAVLVFFAIAMLWISL